MKKNLLLLIVFGMIFTGCKKDKEIENVTMYDLAGRWSVVEAFVNGQPQPVDLATQLSYAEYRVDGTYDEYDYYLNGLYTYPYTIQNNVIISPDGTGELRIPVSHFTGDSFTVTDGRNTFRLARTSNSPRLYLEPTLDFGASRDRIKQTERRNLLKETTDALTYDKTNRVEIGASYLFQNNRMTSGGVFLSLSTDPNELMNFLKASYTLLGIDGDLIVFASRDKRFEVIVGVEQTYVLVVYAYNDQTKANHNDPIENGRRTLRDFERAVAAQ